MPPGDDLAARSAWERVGGESWNGETGSNMILLGSPQHRPIKRLLESIIINTIAAGPACSANQGTSGPSEPSSSSG